MVWGPGFRVEGLGFRDKGSWFRVWGLGIRVYGSGLRKCMGFRTRGLGGKSLGFRVHIVH